MKRSFFWVGTGVALGVLALVSPGSVFIVFLSVMVTGSLYRFSAREDRRFLMLLFLAAFLVRASVSVGLDALSWKVEGGHPSRDGEVQGWNLHINDKTRGYLKIGDSDYFSQRGYAIAQFVEGSNEPVVSFRMNQYGKHGYVYAIGWFYHLFGFSPCAVKLINGLLGGGMAILVFLLGQSCFGTGPARWAAVLTAIFPSLILWSATNLKDIPLAFFTLLILVLYSRMIQAKRWKSRLIFLLLLVASLSVHMTFRSVELSVLLAAALLAAYFLTHFVRIQPFRTTIILLAMLTLGVILSFLKRVGYWIRSALAQPFNWHIGFDTTPGSSYRFLPAPFYEGSYRWEWVETGRMSGAILLGMGQAVLHYLFEPFPWNISSPFELFAYPQLIVWYALFPFAVTGLILGLRKKQESALALVLTTVVFTTIGALASGNIGTVFRQRDTVTPLFLILGCAGLHRAITLSTAQGSLILRALSRPLGRLRTAVGVAMGSIARAFWNGPIGTSLLTQPLRCAGILGIAALTTFWIGTLVLGKSITDWEWAAGTTFWALSLPALLCGGRSEQVIQGSRVLQFLRRS